QYCPPTAGVDIEQWPRGMYEVDIVVDRRLVATGTFEMRAKDQIYEEVRAKAVDRSTPVGAINELDARVTALRFFEAGGRTPASAQRAYSTRFSRATTRDIAWQLDLAHPPPHRWLGIPIEALLFFRDATGERLLQRKVSQAAVPADWPDTHQL